MRNVLAMAAVLITAGTVSAQSPGPLHQVHTYYGHLVYVSPRPDVAGGGKSVKCDPAANSVCVTVVMLTTEGAGHADLYEDGKVTSSLEFGKMVETKNGDAVLLDFYDVK